MLFPWGNAHERTLSVRTPLSGSACTGPTDLLTFRISQLPKKSLLIKISPHRSRSLHVALRCALAAAVFLVAHPISRRTAPPSSIALHPPTAPAPARCASCPRYCAPCLVPRAHRGAADVVVPHRRSWPLSTP
jgi:hypothetical protein